MNCNVAKQKERETGRRKGRIESGWGVGRRVGIRRERRREETEGEVRQRVDVGRTKKWKGECGRREGDQGRQRRKNKERNQGIEREDEGSRREKYEGSYL